MKLKEFLNPDWRKTVLFVFFIMLSIIFPLIPRQLNILLIGTLVFYYLFSCLIVWVYEIIKEPTETIDDYDRVKQIMKTGKGFGGKEARIKLRSLESSMKKKRDTEED